MQPADRIRVFRHTLEEAVSERVVPGPHTVGLFADSVANVYDLNYLRAAEPAPAVVLADEAEHAMETFLHRKVVVERDGREAASGFAALGWNVTPHLIMARQREADRVVDTSMVREVDFDELLDARREVTVAEPTGDLSLSQLLDRGKRRIIAAVPTRFFAAFVNGRVAAYCELRSDGAVAQIEDVNTLAEFRGRGLGRAVVQAAVEEAGRNGELVFLEALADDWPKELYAKLGFDVVDERVLFLRPPSPLTKLRVRTPRLELRLATAAELRSLARVAQAGIHDPDRMPFEEAWTDAAGEPDFENGFVEHHVSSLGRWRPDAWVLNLVAFADGQPVGAQALRGEEIRRGTDGRHRLLARPRVAGPRARHRDARRRAAARVRGPRRPARHLGCDPGQSPVARRLAQAGLRGDRQPPGQPPRRAGGAPRPRAAGGRLLLTGAGRDHRARRAAAALRSRAVILRAFGETFVTLFVITDPIGNAPIFVAITRNLTPRERQRAALRAVIAAGALILGFAVFGEIVLRYLHVSLGSLSIAGGLLLMLVALEMLRGSDFPGGDAGGGGGRCTRAARDAARRRAWGDRNLDRALARPSGRGWASSP